MSLEKQVSIFPELSSWFPIDCLPGGDGLNSIRVAQWMLHLEKATSIIGAVGRDETAARLIQSCEKVGIRAEFFVQDDEPTGATARLVCDDAQTELVNVGAGNTYSKERHLDTGKYIEDQNILSKFSCMVSEVKKKQYQNFTSFYLNKKTLWR